MLDLNEVYYYNIKSFALSLAETSFILSFLLLSHVDSAIEGLPGITMSKPGPLKPLVIALQQLVVETGEALSNEGSASLGQHIMNLVGAPGV